MPKFIYVARDSSGVKVSGFEDGVGKEDVIERLQKRNLLQDQHPLLIIRNWNYVL